MGKAEVGQYLDLSFYMFSVLSPTNFENVSNSFTQLPVFLQTLSHNLVMALNG